MFKREFKINLKSLIMWTIGLLATYLLIFAVYPNLITQDTKASLMQMMNSMPKEMLSVFNMDIVGIESAYGWFRTEGYVFLTLVGGLYAAILGSTVLVKEESDKTIEFLYSKPISREKIVTSKILCGIVNIIIFAGVITIGNYFALSGLEDFKIKEFLMISLIPLLLYFMLFFITMFISTFLKKTKGSMGTGVAFVFISYIMQIIGSMGDKLEIVKQISPFEFVSSRYIILNNSLDYKYLLIGIGVIIVSMIGTYVRYNRKEFI
ncbi:MAG: ABC transporter permease subunit [Clostridia bacterium]